MATSHQIAVDYWHLWFGTINLCHKVSRMTSAKRGLALPQSTNWNVLGGRVAILSLALVLIGLALPGLSLYLCGHPGQKPTCLGDKILHSSVICSLLRCTVEFLECRCAHCCHNGVRSDGFRAGCDVLVKEYRIYTFNSRKYTPQRVGLSSIANLLLL